MKQKLYLVINLREINRLSAVARLSSVSEKGKVEPSHCISLQLETVEGETVDGAEQVSSKSLAVSVADIDERAKARLAYQPKPEASYSFEFVDGGQNCVRAVNAREAFKKAVAKFPGLAPKRGSFKRLSAAGYRKYCDSLPNIN